MDIRIDRSSPTPVYQQIRGSIQEMILSGKLPDGFRLPPERKLAQALRVNRTTILNAYRELKADGFVDAHVGRGTQVVPRKGSPIPGEPLPSLPWRQLARANTAREPDPLLRDLLELTERRDVISLSVGLPAPELLPIEELRRIQEELLREKGAEMLLHSPTEGVTALREALCGHILPRGIRATPEEILVTSGAQQGMDLVIRTFLAPGDSVVVEEPTYFGALEAFRAAQVRLLSVPTDEEGMRTEILEALLERQRPRLIYTLPTFQNPSGRVLGLSRRRHLLDLAYRYQIPVLEDDPYSDLRYEGESLPSLKALDSRGHVLHVSSFSKVLFPGLRLGWLAAPKAVVRQLALVKQAADLHSNTYGQWILERFLGEGLFAAHVEKVRRAYARKRDIMRTALEAHAPSSFTWSKPQGGYYMWCCFSGAVPPGRLLARAAQERVSYLPGGASFVEEPGANFLRLNFTFASESEIQEGVERLMNALKAVEAEPRSQAHAVLGTPPMV